ncbi:hypothetical protein [Streptacidiphilus anmyonensis]|uniref:hypothetical protein n=1 Tax=Streptacidiphilus anmyonensis TaxID=405782 RepID=UPI0005AA01DD|nr:hypothetical protein [Streptacidiphilus anmyonensis]
MPENSAQRLPTTDRQWDALGLLHRLEGQGVPAGRGTGGLHLATLKPLATMGLVILDESGEPDRRGRQWTARLTEAGHRALDQDENAGP